ncbi:MAG: hypothetical protein SGJ19_28675 [Planctomycetia bacterium]|nr:hypothetical protein [Planctomycetia bacterium]
MAAMGKERITDLSEATALTVPNGAKLATITNTGCAVRYWTDGSVPTAVQGHVLPSGESLTLTTASGLATAQFIAESDVAVLDSGLEVSYFNHQS